MKKPEKYAELVRSDMYQCEIACVIRDAMIDALEEAAKLSEKALKKAVHVFDDTVSVKIRELKDSL